MKAKGGLSGLSPLRSHGSHDSPARRLDRGAVAKDTHGKLNLKGGCQAEVHSDQMVHMVVKQEAGLLLLQLLFQNMPINCWDGPMVLQVTAPVSLWLLGTWAMARGRLERLLARWSCLLAVIEVAWQWGSLGRKW
jgi:hypothetical protein